MKVLEGPFYAQHDVDILDDKTLVFFNNNSYVVWANNGMTPPENSEGLVSSGEFFSSIISYDLCDQSFKTIGEGVFRENGIYSHTEGEVECLDKNTWFVEQQNIGIIWIIRGNRVIYKNVFKSPYRGYHHLANWTRIVNQG